MTPKGHAIPSKTQLLSYGTPAFRRGAQTMQGGDPYFAALAALMASMSMGVTLNRSPQMP